MYVNLGFVKLFVQRNEFKSCWKLALYKNYYYYYHYYYYYIEVQSVCLHILSAPPPPSPHNSPSPRPPCYVMTKYISLDISVMVDWA